MLYQLATADPDAEKTIHTLKSSNLPFYSAIWEAAKASKGLVTFHKRFYWDSAPTRDSKRSAQKRCALVDVVAEDGEEWIKVSTTSIQRLMFELAKARWEFADSSEDDEDEDENEDEEENRNASQVNGVHTAEDDEISRIELVRTAVDLHRASQAHRIHYEHPRVRFVFPKISDPPPAELLPMFDRIRSTGAIVDLGIQSDAACSIEALKENIFPHLLPSPHPPLTSTLNIDCTILLALVSDLSYTANHPIHPSYNGAICRQIELETRDHLLPSSLWPAMANKTLVCTAEAAKRMREIVDTIGMPKEKARTELIMENQDEWPVEQTDARNGVAKSQDQLIEGLQAYSDYMVPSTFCLPIRIVVSPTASVISTAIQTGQLPAVAETIAEELTDINRSVFMYGWLHGYTTVSSNRTVTKAIESTMEKKGQGDKGPKVWLREPARSLLGKEKERRK